MWTHSSETHDVNFWQRLGVGLMRVFPGQGAQIQAGPPGGTATASRAGRTWVLGSCRTGSWDTHSCPLTPRGGPPRTCRPGREEEAPAGALAPQGTTCQAGPRGGGGGTADTRFSQLLQENTPTSRPAAGTRGPLPDPLPCKAEGTWGGACVLSRNTQSTQRAVGGAQCLHCHFHRL